MDKQRFSPTSPPLPKTGQKESPEPAVVDSPGLAPDQRVQHGGQSPQDQADVGGQGGEQSLLAVVRTEVQSRLADPAEEKKPPGERKYFIMSSKLIGSWWW